MTDKELKTRIIKHFGELFGFTPEEMLEFKDCIDIEEITVTLSFYYKNCLYNAHSEYIRCAVNPMTESCEGCQDYEARKPVSQAQSSESSLNKIWLSPEEDEAWQDL